MAKNPVEIGPTGERVAANIAALRKHKKLSQCEVAKRAELAGRNLPASAISKIEKLDRRLDIDDLIVLALALGVSPAELLAPLPGDEEDVDLTPTVTSPADEARAWMAGGATGGQWQAVHKLLVEMAMLVVGEGLADFDLTGRLLSSGQFTPDEAQALVRVAQATAAKRKARYDAMKEAFDGEGTARRDQDEDGQ